MATSSNIDTSDLTKQEKHAIYHLQFYNKRLETRLEARGARYLVSTSLTSFAAIPTDIPRVLVVGEARNGKSSLCNKFAGVKYVLKEIVAERKEGKESNSEADEEDEEEEEEEDDIKYEVQALNPDAELFETSADVTSVTSRCAWAKVKFLGNARKGEIVVIDTPGLNDMELRKAEEYGKHLQEVLKYVGYVDVVLVVLGQLGGTQGLDAGIRTMIYTVKALVGFIQDSDAVNKHFMFAFTHCDTGETGWKISSEARLAQWQATLQTEFKYDGEFPLFTFSSVQNPKTNRWKWSQLREFNRFLEETKRIAQTSALKTPHEYIMDRVSGLIDGFDEDNPRETYEKFLKEFECTNSYMGARMKNYYATLPKKFGRSLLMNTGGYASLGASVAMADGVAAEMVLHTALAGGVVGAAVTVATFGAISLASIPVVWFKERNKAKKVEQTLAQCIRKAQELRQQLGLST